MAGAQALPTAGRSCILFTSASKARRHAAIRRRACTAGSWRDASAADGRRAAPHAHELERDARARSRRAARVHGGWVARGKHCRRREGRVSCSHARERCAGTLPSGGAHARQAAREVPALLTAGRPRLVLMSSSKVCTHAAIGTPRLLAALWGAASRTGRRRVWSGGGCVLGCRWRRGTPRWRWWSSVRRPGRGVQSGPGRDPAPGRQSVGRSGRHGDRSH